MTGSTEIDIVRAETDTVVFGLVNVPRDLAAFAEDLYKFCPDIVDQGAGSIEALQENVAGGRVLLWWD